MKRMIVIFAVALCACQPPVDETSGTFETFSVARVQPTECVFTPIGAPDSDEPLFVTRKGDLNHMGYVRYKDETLKLLPRVVPNSSSATIDMSYDVIDYLKWTVRLEAARQDDGSYTGSLSLAGTEVSANVTGSCGV